MGPICLFKTWPCFRIASEGVSSLKKRIKIIPLGPRWIPCQILSPGPYFSKQARIAPTISFTCYTVSLPHHHIFFHYRENTQNVGSKSSNFSGRFFGQISLSGGQGGAQPITREISTRFGGIKTSLKKVWDETPVGMGWKHSCQWVCVDFCFCCSKKVMKSIHVSYSFVSIRPSG